MKHTLKILSFALVLTTFNFKVLALTYTETHTSIFKENFEKTVPTFTDLDNDGLLDLVMGEEDGQLHHYEQDSSGSSTFTEVEDTFSLIDVGDNSTPTFTDLDNDNLLDLVVGNSNGTLSHFEQDSLSSLSFTEVPGTFSLDAGSRAAPTFTDLDNDGLLDLVVGENDGSLNHYEQDSLSSLSFTEVLGTFSLDVGQNAVPFFTDLDNDNLLDLVVGESSGNLNHYEQDSLSSLSFTEVSGTFSLDVGSLSTPTFTDLNLDGVLDLVVGENESVLNHYSQDSLSSLSFTEVDGTFADLFGIEIGSNSNPTTTDLDNDGLIDIILGYDQGFLLHYEQDTSGSLSFTEVSGTFSIVDVFSDASPTFTDIDNDGRLDLISGGSNGRLYHYEQDAEASLSFTEVVDTFIAIDVGTNATPTFTDLDNDGLLDLVVGSIDGTLYHYEQASSGSLSFSIELSTFSLDVGVYATPNFTDLDSDGLLDLVVGESDGSLNHYEQDSSGSLSFTEILDSDLNMDSGSNSAPVFIDINNDSLDDILLGNGEGGLKLFLASAECGDGIITATAEECDDSNTTDSDGCSSACETELSYCTDTDDDGFGSDSACTYYVPTDPDITTLGLILDNSDCDDALSSVNSEATEVCDEIDNNCDGNIDEGFDDLGDVCSSGVGACEDAGVMACSEDGLSTFCDAVALESITEICDDSIDNDCDGETDEDCNETDAAASGGCSLTGFDSPSSMTTFFVLGFFTFSSLLRLKRNPKVS